MDLEDEEQVTRPVNSNIYWKFNVNPGLNSGKDTKEPEDSPTGTRSAKLHTLTRLKTVKVKS